MRLPEPSQQWRLPTRRLGRRVLVFDRLESTNTLAAQLAADPANDGLVVLAREQTAGRGQHGRSWQCPAGDGVLFSVLLFPPPELRRPALFTAWAAVAVCETILQATSLQARIKWPNDVLIRGRKVCGILIEQRSAGSGQTGDLSTVCGIGLNVNQSAESFRQAGLEEAGSLAVVTGQAIDCDSVARQLIQHMDEEYDRLCGGDLGTLEACWQWRVGLLGRPVIAECHDQSHRGRLREMTWEGIVLESAGGDLLRLKPEAIRHLTPQQDSPSSPLGE